MRIASTLAVAAVCLGCSSAFAGNWDPGVNHRQFHQHGRITQGAVSGQLTGREIARLRAEQRAIAFEERVYKRDGHLTAFERADLQRDLNRASRDIYRQKHDAQTR